MIQYNTAALVGELLESGWMLKGATREDGVFIHAFKKRKWWQIGPLRPMEYVVLTDTYASGLETLVRAINHADGGNSSEQ